MSSAIEIDDKYKEGKIYKLIDNTNGNIYIGSTTKTLNQRLSKHKCHYKIYKKGKCSVLTSFEIIKNENYYIQLIENYPCNSKYELELRERYHIETNICLNKQIPTRTIEERLEYNKQYNKKYHLEHIDELKEQMKQYRLEHKDEIKEQRKQNYLENRDERLAYAKKLYEENRENILEKQKVKVKCEICNYEMNKSSMNAHLKTILHHKNLAKIQGRTILFNNNQ